MSTIIRVDKLKSESEIEKIFRIGKTGISSDKKLRINYYLLNSKDQARVKYTVAISSKNGSSVWRNRVKRLIREAIRVEIEIIKELISAEKLTLSIIFSTGALNQSNYKQIIMSDIKPAVAELFQTLCNVIKKQNQK